MRWEPGEHLFIGGTVKNEGYRPEAGLRNDLAKMEVGEELFLVRDMRNRKRHLQSIWSTCSKLKRATGKAYKVRSGKGGFNVVRVQ